MLSFGERTLRFCLILLQCGNLTQRWVNYFHSPVHPDSPAAYGRGSSLPVSFSASLTWFSSNNTGKPFMNHRTPSWAAARCERLPRERGTTASLRAQE